MLTACIMTNGVDFALVAGACCIVKFSVSGYNLAQALKGSSLNINSSGAKTVRHYSAGQSGGSVDAGPLAGSILFTYDGSTYQTVTFIAYGDYSD